MGCTRLLVRVCVVCVHRQIHAHTNAQQHRRHYSCQHGASLGGRGGDSHMWRHWGRHNNNQQQWLPCTCCQSVHSRPQSPCSRTFRYPARRTLSALAATRVSIACSSTCSGVRRACNDRGRPAIDAHHHRCGAQDLLAGRGETGTCHRSASKRSLRV